MRLPASSASAVARHPHASFVTAMRFAAAAAGLALPAAAHAQFGKLRDIGRAAVERQAAGIAQGRGAEAQGEARARTVAFDEEVVEITEARLDALVRGLDAEVAARPRVEREQRAAEVAFREAQRAYPALQAAYLRERAAWDRREAEVRACVAGVEQKHTGAMESAQAEGERTGRQVEADMANGGKQRIEALAAKIKAAHARGDMAEVRTLTEQFQREVARIGSAAAPANARAAAVSEAMTADAKRCGNPGPQPVAPAVPQQPSGAGVLAAGAAAAQMPVHQYAVLRERVEAYVRLNGRTGRSTYSFDRNELGVLAARLGALRERAGQFATKGFDPEGD